jgi:raffinose/stachyose/melibiose transport system permease protein
MASIPARAGGKAFRTLLLALLSLAILFPLYMAVLVALKNPRELAAGILSLPKTLHWGNFAAAAEKTRYFTAFRSSLIVTAASTVLTVFTNSLTAYAIARNWNRRFFRFLYYYFLSAMFIPFSLIMLPIVKQMAALGGTNLPGLIFLYVIYGLPFNTFLYVGYLRTVSREMEEAAMIDGAGSWTVFFRVVMPLMSPINATVAILTALWVWNDFQLPLVIIADKFQHTLPLVQYVFQTQFSANYNLAFASYILVMLPMILVYTFAQNFIIGGVMSGSLKG